MLCFFCRTVMFFVRFTSFQSLIAMPSVQCDSRRIKPGDTFVAIRGSRTDGASFIADALSAGAVEIVADHPRPPSGIPENIRWRTVADARAELARLACIAHRDPSKSLEVFGVTGTNGKTTTAMLMRDILLAVGRPAGLVSTVSTITRPPPPRRWVARLLRRPTPPAPEQASNITTPDAVALQSAFADMLANGCKTAVIEVSSHAIDQHRVAGTRFAALAFTNLTQDHLDYHGTMEAYFQTKRKLFVPFQARAAINVDCPYGRRLFEELKPLHAEQVLAYGSAADADVRFSNEQLTAAGSSFQLDYPGGSQSVDIRLLGRHNIHNVLAAFSLALLNGIPPRSAIVSLGAASPVRGRLERIPVAATPATCFVDYAHTPDALQNVLTTLREITPGRLIVVFGAGGDRDRGKRPLMGATVERLADIAIVTSDNPRSESPQAIIDDILSGMPDPSETRPGRIRVEPDRHRAIAQAVQLASLPGDTVLIAGKGHETGQRFADHTEPFDDRAVLQSSQPQTPASSRTVST